jgi:hypothetical protein
MSGIVGVARSEEVREGISEADGEGSHEGLPVAGVETRA